MRPDGPRYDVEVLDPVPLPVDTPDARGRLRGQIRKDQAQYVQGEPHRVHYVVVLRHEFAFHYRFLIPLEPRCYPGQPRGPRKDRRIAPDESAAFLHRFIRIG